PKTIGRYGRLEIHVAQSNKLPTLDIYGGRQGSNPVSPNTHTGRQARWKQWKPNWPKLASLVISGVSGGGGGDGDGGGGGRFCTAIRNAAVKRLPFSHLLQPYPPVPGLVLSSPYPHFFPSFLLPPRPTLLLREYESVRRNDERIRIKSYFPRCFAIRRLKYRKTASAERLSEATSLLQFHPSFPSSLTPFSLFLTVSSFAPLLLIFLNFFPYTFSFPLFPSFSHFGSNVMYTNTFRISCTQESLRLGRAFISFKLYSEIAMKAARNACRFLSPRSISSVSFLRSRSPESRSCPSLGLSATRNEIYAFSLGFLSGVLTVSSLPMLSLIPRYGIYAAIAAALYRRALILFAAAVSAPRVRCSGEIRLRRRVWDGRWPGMRCRNDTIRCGPLAYKSWRTKQTINFNEQSERFRFLHFGGLLLATRLLSLGLTMAFTYSIPHNSGSKERDKLPESFVQFPRRNTKQMDYVKEVNTAASARELRLAGSTPRDTQKTEQRQTDSRCTKSDERVAAGGAAASSASPHYAARVGVAGGAGASVRERESAARTVRTRTERGPPREGWRAVFGTAAAERAVDRWTSGAIKFQKWKWINSPPEFHSNGSPGFSAMFTVAGPECTCQNFYLSPHLPAREKHGAEVRTMAGPADGLAEGRRRKRKRKKEKSADRGLE
ncbi:hypothetical protein ALC56_04189, partial [Trachymyrmex septentrionalis]